MFKDHFCLYNISKKNVIDYYILNNNSSLYFFLFHPKEHAFVLVFGKIAKCDKIQYGRLLRTISFPM